LVRVDESVDKEGRPPVVKKVVVKNIVEVVKFIINTFITTFLEPLIL